MSHLLLYNQIGILVFLMVLLIIIIGNLLTLEKLERVRVTGDTPLVSILVPARNEEGNITACVNSLLLQSYPNFEVLVYDDHSTDRTGLILEELALHDHRLRVMRGNDLPAGWLGKYWGCQQLAEAARGSLLLFTDADMQFHPFALRQAVSYMLVHQVDMLTALPYEEMVTPGEKLLVPIFEWAILSFLPLPLAFRSHSTFLSFAVGQFMLFKRAAYFAIGGHAAVNNNAADDMALCRKIKMAKKRWRLVDGTAYLRCRMYHHFYEAWQGFSKNLIAAFDYRLAFFLFTWLWVAVIYLQPLFILCVWLAAGQVGADFVVLSLSSVGIALCSWLLVYHRLKFPTWLALCYPVIAALLVALAIDSARQAIQGKASWKGRRLIGPRVRFW